MDIVTSITNIKNIGDKILCRYTALTSGQIGKFSELGTTSAALISPTSSATPDGSFYWIYVGKDYLGRKKFIADRNIQHSISWDVINSSGIVGEKIINLGLGLATRSSIRLLTGGISNTDLDNEWDKIIAKSNLGGAIIAGDTNIWNWSGISSTTSSTGTTPANRISRGNGSVTTTNAPTGLASTGVNATTGFRPVLLIEALVVDKFLIKKDSNYYSIDPKYYDVELHSFLPLTLTGVSMPNKADIDNFGFDDINKILSSITSGSDTFKPIDKFDKFEIKLYKVT